VDELTAGPPEEVVLENAYRKASAVATGLRASGGETRVVLGVDTIVALGQRIYGKPRDRDDAARTLSALSGHAHRVLSGICVIESETVRTAAAVTTVHVRTLDSRWLDWYLETGEWRERAGGYAIQGKGAALITKIDGDYLNVVGLPVQTLLELQPSVLVG
jgi:septum formation protein